MVIAVTDVVLLQQLLRRFVLISPLLDVPAVGDQPGNTARIA